MNRGAGGVIYENGDWARFASPKFGTELARPRKRSVGKQWIGANWNTEFHGELARAAKPKVLCCHGSVPRIPFTDIDANSEVSKTWVHNIRSMSR